MESSDDDLDDDDLPQVQDIQRIWDDDRAGGRDDDDEVDMDDMDNFIDYDEEEGAAAMGEDEREEKRRRRRIEKERRKAMGGRPELAGIDAKWVVHPLLRWRFLTIIFSAWDEIHDVFGHGHEYDWALGGDEEAEYDEDHLKPEMKYQDVCIVKHIVVHNLTSFLRFSNRPKSVPVCSPKTTI